MSVCGGWGVRVRGGVGRRDMWVGVGAWGVHGVGVDIGVCLEGWMSV